MRSSLRLPLTKSNTFLLANIREPKNLSVPYFLMWVPSEFKYLLAIPKSIMVTLERLNSSSSYCPRFTMLCLSLRISVMGLHPTSTLSGFKSLCTNPFRCNNSKLPSSYIPIWTTVFTENESCKQWPILYIESPSRSMMIQYFLEDTNLYTAYLGL